MRVQLIGLLVEGEADELDWDWRGLAFDSVGASCIEGCGSTGWLKLSLAGEDAVAAVNSADLHVLHGEHAARRSVSLGGGADPVAWPAWF